MSDTNTSYSTLQERLDDTEGCLKAMDEGTRKAMLRHKWEKVPVVVWRDNKVAYIQPDEIDDNGNIIENPEVT